jgi:hypothetical protein
MVACSVLGFDGTALAFFGWWSKRNLLTVLGVICFATAALVVLYWRWYQGRLRHITTLRQGVADEARELQRFLSEK